jgi:hypothetical protein
MKDAGLIWEDVYGVTAKDVARILRHQEREYRIPYVQ